MLGVKYIDIVLLVNIVLFNSYGLGVEKCTPYPPCKCEYDDGRIIDLNALSKENFINGTEGNVTYYFHPCANKALNVPDVIVVPNKTVTQSCKDGTSVGFVK